MATLRYRAPKKGYPIVADSLKLQYGSAALTDGVTQALHFFTYTNALDLGDMAYCYNNDKNGVYFFWDTDENAYSREAAEAAETASTFSFGYIAIAAAAGIAVGIAGTGIFTWLRKKKSSKQA